MDLLKYDMGAGVIAFSTKRGKGDEKYGAFNITHYCGDNPEHVATCRKELCNALEIEDASLILPRQTHDSETLLVDEGFMQCSDNERCELLHGIDAIVTRLPMVCIGVSTADCVPVLLHDCTTGTAATIHAGWRGTVARIVEKCIEVMRRECGCEPQNIKAVIAPSIGCEAFEVGDEVYAAFEDAGFPMQDIAVKKEKWHIDLWEANRRQLLHCGLCKENIHVAGVCTHTRCDEFFSARRLGINSGRIFNGIMITNAHPRLRATSNERK